MLLYCYLSFARSQVVFLKVASSEVYFFILYINDITDNLTSSSTSTIFADDIKIYTELIKQNSNTNFQTQLDNIHLWSISWQLKISHSKCILLCQGRQRVNGVTFSIKWCSIVCWKVCNWSGVTIDNGLKFNKRINDLVARAKQRAALIQLL